MPTPLDALHTAASTWLDLLDACPIAKDYYASKPDHVKIHQWWDKYYPAKAALAIAIREWLNLPAKQE